MPETSLTLKEMDRCLVMTSHGFFFIALMSYAKKYIKKQTYKNSGHMRIRILITCISEPGSARIFLNLPSLCISKSCTGGKKLTSDLKEGATCPLAIAHKTPELN